ncbi:MAG: hypothetical protein ACWA5P_13605 [bacterium]
MIKKIKILSTYRPILFWIGLLFLSCSKEQNHNIKNELKANINQSEPNLHKTTDGRILLSYIETDSSNVSTLKWSKLEQDSIWSTGKTITSGNNWFVNWADFPSIASFGNNLTTHYLEKSAPDTYAYDIKVIISNNFGESWNTAFTIHNDSTNTEHGFVSKATLQDHSMLHVWLDGRKYAYAEKDTTISKEMTLRAATFNKDGELLTSNEIDSKVCDCCQTSTTATSDGAIVVYRDRSDNEIRDIYYSKLVDGYWSTPKAVFNDGWQIEGCPVNGPVVKSLNNTVAVAWFTAADSKAKIKIAFSENSGTTFNQPIELDYVRTIGRIDLLLTEEKAFVSWLDTRNNHTAIFLQAITPTGEKSEVHVVTNTSSNRSSGFPKMEFINDKIVLVHTSFDENTKRSELQTHFISFNEFNSIVE